MEDDRKGRKDRSGFTLVELVVVIAILGILAGVAYAGYGGYLEYAKRAGDDDLIASVNLALATACEDQGVDRNDLYTVALEYGSTDDTINGLSMIVSKSGADLTAIKEIFKEYFSGNEETKLEYYGKDDIEFINGIDMFSADREKIMKKWQDAFMGSNVSKDPDTVKDSLYNGKRLLKRLMDNTKYDDMFYSFFGGGSKDGLIDMLQQLGYDIPDDATSDQISNSLILYCAKTAANMDPQTAKDEFMDMDIGKLLQEQPEGKLRDLALIAGVTSAYANSEQCDPKWKESFKEALSKEHGSDAVFALSGVFSSLQKTLQDQAENGTPDDYYHAEFSNDMQGILATLSAIDQNQDSFDLESDSLDDQFQSIFDQLYTSKS